MTVACAQAPALGLRRHRAVGREGPGCWVLRGRARVRQPAPPLTHGEGPGRAADRGSVAGDSRLPFMPSGLSWGTAGRGLRAQGSACSEWEKDQVASERQPSSCGHLGSQCILSMSPWDAVSRHPSWGRFAISWSPPAAPAPAVSLLRFCFQGPASPAPAPAQPGLVLSRAGRPPGTCSLSSIGCGGRRGPFLRAFRVWKETGEEEGTRAPGSREAVCGLSVCSNHVLSRTLRLSLWPFRD